MQTAWITGARGFIGRHLTKHLAASGMRVCGIGHGHVPTNSLTSAGLYRWSNSEITPEGLGQLSADSGRPDFIYHLAGGSSVGVSLQAPYEDYTRTVNTTARLLEWVRVHSPQSKLVVASSAAVYGDTGGNPALELRRPAPVSPYGYHKLMMEQLCAEYSQVFGLQTAALRLFSVYGQGLQKQLLWDCSVKLTSGVDSIELGGSGDELRDWVNIEDAVALLVLVSHLADRESPQFNGGSGVGVSVREVVSQLSTALGTDTQIRFSGVTRSGDPKTLVADPARINAAGVIWKVPLTVGLQRYADWFREVRNAP